MKNNKLSFLFLLCCFLILTSCKKEHIHSVSGPQIHDEYTHWFPCECGYKLFVEPHLYSDWNVLQSETCEDNGVKERTCYCGRVENEVIEKKGHSICSYFSGDEIHHWNPCSNCDKQFNFSRHTFVKILLIRDMAALEIIV